MTRKRPNITADQRHYSMLGGVGERIRTPAEKSRRSLIGGAGVNIG